MRLGDALQAILDCAQVELVAAGRTVPEDVFIAPGLPAYDNRCGQLWARVIRGGPTTEPPNPDLILRPCGKPVWFQIGLGIIRCQTGIERIDQGGYPLPAEQTADALGLICDAGALFRALACCQSSPGEDDVPDIIVEEWTQEEPQGSVIGGEWTAFIEADLYCEETSP